MKKHFTVMSIILSCFLLNANGQSKQGGGLYIDKIDSLTRHELLKGHFTDTAFMTFRFGDPPSLTAAKLKALIKQGNILVDESNRLRLYKFPKDNGLRNGSWKMSFKYANEGLAEVYISNFITTADIKSGEIISISQIKDALQHKYGACSETDSTTKEKYSEYQYFWIRNNLKVHLFVNQGKEIKPPAIVILTFSDTRHDKITIRVE